MLFYFLHTSSDIILKKKKKWCRLQFEIISSLPNTCVIQNLQMHKMACFQMFCKNALGNIGSDQTREEFYDKMQRIYWITNAKICTCYLNYIKINISRTPRIFKDNLHNIFMPFWNKQYAYLLVRNATLLQQKYHCVENAQTLWNNLIHQSKLRNKTSK